MKKEERRMQKGAQKTSNIQHPTSSIQRRTLNLEPRTLNFESRAGASLLILPTHTGPDEADCHL